MSWSIEFVGKPEQIAAAITEESDRLTGQSKAEFDGAKDHLAALVNQNFDKMGYARHTLVRLRASGSGTVGRRKIDEETLGEPEPVYRSLIASIELIQNVIGDAP